MDGWISRRVRYRVVRFPNPLAIGSQLGNLTRYREPTVLIISDGKLSDLKVQRASGSGNLTSCHGTDVTRTFPLRREMSRKLFAVLCLEKDVKEAGERKLFDV